MKSFQCDKGHHYTSSYNITACPECLKEIWQDVQKKTQADVDKREQKD